jgi:hypothetical protein
MPDSGEHVSFRQGPVGQRGKGVTAQQGIDDADAAQQPRRPLVGCQPVKLGECLADPADVVLTEWRDFQLGRGSRRLSFPADACKDLGDRLVGIVTRYGDQAQSGLRGCLGQVMKQPGAGLLCGLGSSEDYTQRGVQELGRGQPRGGRKVPQAQRGHCPARASDLFDRGQYRR